ncbi:anther-specific protein LAT52-like [Coffea eugenioides]|uniref:Anther-specific protein LAT52-like n=1 Tax=Coffea arabica TaxID=13443 RepID=A0A6P6XKK5_COFAR|nr:anther-specific protein LAT52-like [Coffea arabica]XP_027172250.1 anther-specific protein LAT52-like [Coffea eugenioides]
MAKAVAVVSALCFLALASLAHAQEAFTVKGRVYCDPCRVEFQTSLSKSIEGAEVELQCRVRENGTVTVSQKATTDANGNYELTVQGDHEEEICDVASVSSPSQECNVPFGENKARILLTQNNGVQGTDRFANPLGYKTTEANPDCKAILQEMGYIPDENGL